MNQELFERLNAERTHRLDQAAQKLLDGDDLNEASKQLAWVDTAGKVIGAAAQKKGGVQGPVIGAIIISLILLGLAWTLHVPSVHVTADVNAETVGIKLDSTWRPHQRMNMTQLFINQIASLDAPGLPQLAVASPENPASLELAGQIVVTALEIPANAVLEFSRSGDALHVFVKQTQLHLTVQAGKADVTMRPAYGDPAQRRISSEIPETIMITTMPTGAAAVELRLSGLENWRLRGMDIKALKFVEEYPPDSGQFESVIRSGSVLIEEVNKTQKLLDGQFLNLSPKKSRRAELVPAEDPEQLRMTFEGLASKAHFGAQDFTTNLSPTWFEYILQQKPISAFWGAMIFLIGLVLKIRNILFA